MIDRRWWWLVFALAVATIVIEMQWTHAISWDELEFFRATRWVAEGRVPYRDFWEHHLPLQWVVFAPFAIPLGGTGVSMVLWLRWLQIPFWAAMIAAAARLLRAEGMDADVRKLTLLLAASSRFAYTSALEYRVDTIGTVAFVIGIALVWLRPRQARAWWGFGALMSAAVLANMRLAPFVAFTAIAVSLVDGEQKRWRWNARSLWMLGGVAIVATAFLAALFATGTVDAFVECMRFNIESDRLASGQTHTFWPVVWSAFRELDFGAMALWIFAIGGAAMVLREIRRPGLFQLLAILAIVSVGAVAMLGVQYIYHLELSFLLMAPIAALALARWKQYALAALGLIVAVNLATRSELSGYRYMQYENVLMHELDRVTAPGEKVWDGVGYAFHRPPAYKYWFLPAGVRMLASAGSIEPYDAPQMLADPPAAIVYGTRIHFWFSAFPRSAIYAARHYIPLYRNLWVPGLSALLAPGATADWVVPKSGTYRVAASSLLAKHPWFAHPLKYGLVAGPDAPLYQVDVRKLPLERGIIHVTVNGARATRTIMQLRRGDKVHAEGTASQAIGIMIVPAGEHVFFTSPEEQFY